MPTTLPSLGGFSLDSASTAGSSVGITVAAPAGTNTKNTTWTQLIASTTIDTAWIAAQLWMNTSAASGLVDIGVGASTSEIVLIPDIYCYSVASGSQLMSSYVFPVNVPAGTRLSARAASSVTIASMRLTVQCIGPGRDGIGGLGRVEACGTVSGSSSLTAVDPGASANTDVIGELIASTSFDYRWLFICAAFDDNTTATTATALVDIMAGAGGSEVALINDIGFSVGSGPDADSTQFGVPIAVPAGTRLSARVRSNINTAGDRVVDVCVWGCG